MTVGFTSGALLFDSISDTNTYVPTIIGTSTPGTATYTTQVGRYTKMGDLVFFNVFLAWATGNGTGNLAFTIPFAHTADANSEAVSALDLSSVPWPAGKTQVVAVGSIGNSRFDLFGMQDNAAEAAIAYSASGTLLCTGWYRT